MRAAASVWPLAKPPVARAVREIARRCVSVWHVRVMQYVAHACVLRRVRVPRLTERVQVKCSIAHRASAIPTRSPIIRIAAGRHAVSELHPVPISHLHSLRSNRQSDGKPHSSSSKHSSLMMGARGSHRPSTDGGASSAGPLFTHSASCVVSNSLQNLVNGKPTTF